VVAGLFVGALLLLEVAGGAVVAGATVVEEPAIVTMDPSSKPAFASVRLAMPFKSLPLKPRFCCSGGIPVSSSTFVCTSWMVSNGLTSMTTFLPVGVTTVICIPPGLEVADGTVVAGATAVVVEADVVLGIFPGTPAVVVAELFVLEGDVVIGIFPGTVVVKTVLGYPETCASIEGELVVVAVVSGAMFL